jgi:hypothetical protein
MLQSRWTLLLQFELSVLQQTLLGRCFTVGEHYYFSLKKVHYSEQYLDDASQQVDTGIAA